MDYEATSRFADREQFISDLKKLGFSQVTYEDSYIWTHIRATKDGQPTPTEVQKIRGL
jgi:hypothetical protein